ncbi:MAG: RnfABCDGE type electron transport complex subunit D [Nitrososphaerales archaeon]
MQLILSLLTLICIAINLYGIEISLQILTPVITAFIIDVIIHFVKFQKLTIPWGAIISGMIIGLMSIRAQALYIPFLTAVVAIISKHVIRKRKKNIFNPAAFSLLIVSFLFPREFYLNHSNYLLERSSVYFAYSYLRLNKWEVLIWSTHCAIGFASSMAIIVLGLLIAYRARKLNLTLSFLITYASIFTICALYVNQDVSIRLLIEFFGAGGGLFFFTFFMLTDPPTSPLHNQNIYGVITALMAFILRFIINPIQFLLITLILMNALVDLIDIKLIQLSNSIKKLFRV